MKMGESMKSRWSFAALCFFVHLAGCGSAAPTPHLLHPEDSLTGQDDSTVDSTADDLGTKDSPVGPTDDNLSSDSEEYPDESIQNPDLLNDSVCVPDCAGRECGSDGCGSTCGHCPSGSDCVASICVLNVGCTPGVRQCAGTVAIECDDSGSGWQSVEDCAQSGKSCQFGYCSGCVQNCDGKSCGDDGCGGSCGTCPQGSLCGSGVCMMSCDSELCALGKVCLIQESVPALCGGTLTFDTDMQGNNIEDDVNVEEEYVQAGVRLFSDDQNAVVRTNYYELDSDSGGNSCATKVGNYEYWTHPIYLQFIYPTTGGYQQGFVYNFSLYIGNTWTNGIVVAAFAPNADFYSSGEVEPITYKFTADEGTAFVEIQSDQPIGYAYIDLYEDHDFTIDDFSFGPIQPYVQP